MPERKHPFIDPARRLNGREPILGQYCRAFVDKDKRTVETVAVEELDAESFHVWMGSRDSRAFIEDCLALACGYGYLHKRDPMGRWPAEVPRLAEIDPIEAIDRRIDQILARPGMFVPSVGSLEVVIMTLLELRCSLLASSIDLRDSLFACCRKHGIAATALGPAAAILEDTDAKDRFARALEFYRDWVATVRAHVNPSP